MQLLDRLRYVDNDLKLWLQIRLDATVDRVRVRNRRAEIASLVKGVRYYCTFVGYPRSGHSLYSSILDAHPDAAFSHRLDALKYIERGCEPAEVFYLILKNSERFARSGRRLTAYAYAIADQWQGRARSLAVIGDQEANWATLRLREHPGLLTSFACGQSFELEFIHTIRNPFDNIATMANRRQTSLAAATERYFSLCAGVQRVKESYGKERVLDVYHEDMIERPESEITRLLGFVGLDASPEFIESCRRIVYRSPNHSRLTRPWAAGEIVDVLRRAAAHDYLARYGFAL